MAAESSNRQPLAKNQLAIALLVLILIIAIGVGLYFLLHHSKKGHSGTNGRTYPTYAAKVLTANQIQHLAPRIGGEVFYWAGPQTGYGYEVRRTKEGWIYVRYLPAGLHAGAIGNFRVIASYPWLQALNGLKAQAKKVNATVKHSRGGGYYFVDPKRPRTVYMAWSNVDIQVEIFGTSAVDAVTLARSGKIVPAD